MAKAKKNETVTVKAFGAFSKTIKIPYAVSRHTSGFSNWVLRNLTIRPITITYELRKESTRGKK